MGALLVMGAFYAILLVKFRVSQPNPQALKKRASLPVDRTSQDSRHKADQKGYTVPCVTLD